MTTNLTIVTAAIIEKDGKILIARSAPDQKLAGKREFPGGKLEEAVCGRMGSEISKIGWKGHKHDR